MLGCAYLITHIVATLSHAMTQEEALNILKTGANVFLTGEPGSGKTHTVNAYVAYLKNNGIEPAITASTGIAATHIGGSTIHSWCGIGIKSALSRHELASILDNKRVTNRVKKAQVLIIDEISMLSAETFQLVEQVCRAIRTSKVPGATRGQLPFGGLQVVLVGDFFQLPPIVKPNAPKPAQMDFQDLDADADQDITPFAFRTSAWEELDLVVCYLSEQHRQDDGDFLFALNAIRRNAVNQEVRDSFTSRVVTAMPGDTVTKLFPHNADVDRINTAELTKLPSNTKTYQMVGRGAPPIIEGLKRSCLSPEVLSLKVGARVMFTKNNPEGKYVNGTLGEVITFAEKTGAPVVKTRAGKIIDVEPTEWAVQDGDKVLAAVVQFPLRLAWAITVHKSQGMSLDAAVIDLRQAFEYGQGYVALSRVRTLDGLYLLGFNDRALEVHPQVSHQDARFRDQSARHSQKYATFAPVDLQKLHDNFVAASGGEKGSGPKKPEPKIPTQIVTKNLLIKDKRALPEIANIRAMTVSTIIGHLEKLVAEKEISLADIAYLKPKSARFEPIKKTLFTVQKKDGQMFLSQTRELLGSKYTFDEIRLVRLFLH